MFSIGYSEIVLILVVALVVLKPEDWPNLLYSLGRFFRSLQIFFNHGTRAIHQVIEDVELEEIRKKALKNAEKSEKSLSTSQTLEKFSTVKKKETS